MFGVQALLMMGLTIVVTGVLQMCVVHSWDEMGNSELETPQVTLCQSNLALENPL